MDANRAEEHQLAAALAYGRQVLRMRLRGSKAGGLFRRQAGQRPERQQARKRRSEPQLASPSSVETHRWLRKYGPIDAEIRYSRKGRAWGKAIYVTPLPVSMRAVPTGDTVGDTPFPASGDLRKQSMQASVDAAFGETVSHRGNRHVQETVTGETISKKLGARNVEASHG